MLEDLNIEIFGYIAGFLTAAAYMPQLIKIVQTKSAKDLSNIMLITYMIGTTCWLLHGIIFQSISMIIFNSLIILEILVITILKFTYANKTVTDGENNDRN